MKLVMTLLARDEADIVDAQIAFHLNAGVDFVIATDNRSEDGTTEILESYAREGHLHLIREPGDDMRQDEWVTRMARLAATELGADWVIHSDADEFWWPRGGTLKEIFALVPERYGLVRGCWRHFVPRPDDGSFFAERMTVRLAAPAPARHKASPFHVHQKVAHRADPHVRVAPGNHDAFGESLAPLRSWYPVEVLHFPLRTVQQLERKCVNAWTGWTRNPNWEPSEHQIRAYEAFQEGRLREYYDSLAVDDGALARSLEEGSLAIDTRLRDALRTLRVASRESNGAREFMLPSDATSRLTFPRPDVADDAAYAAYASPLVELDGVVRAERRLGELEVRLGALERSVSARLRATALRIARR